MLIKSADDKTKRLTLLQDLQNSQLLDDAQKKRLGEDIFKLRRGIQGEKAAAHYLDNYFGDGKNSAIIHDLRLNLDGEIAQIDHLVINRILDFFLLETKSFGGDITITPHGEFSVKYAGDRTYNIPSPIEQSKRHENVLRRLLNKLEIKGRAGIGLRFKHVVLVDPKAAIKRPDAKLFDSSMVIGADQFRTWQLAHLDKEVGAVDVITTLFNVRGSDAVKEVAEKIVRQHKPENLLTLPDWLLPKLAPPKTAGPQRLSVAEVKTPKSPGRKTLTCMTCGMKITYEEGKFCWNNEKRFNGGQYCRPHQNSF